MTAADWPIVKQIAQIFGLIMRGLYILLSAIGIENIAICILVFVFISKIILLPSDYRKRKFYILTKRITPEIIKINKKYDHKLDHPMAKLKLNVDRGALLDKYNMVSSRSIATIFIQLPIVFALFAIINNMPRFVPELNNLSAEALEASYYIFGFSIKEAIGFKLTPAFLLPIASFFLSIAENLVMSGLPKFENKKQILTWTISTIMSNGLTFYFSVTFPAICCLYWTSRSVANIIITLLVDASIKMKPASYFAEKELKKKNRERKKKGLEPLGLDPLVVV